jgi:hypothetical protein
MRIQTNTKLFEQFKSASTEELRQEVAKELLDGGYSAFSHFLHHFKEELKKFFDDDIHIIQGMLDKAKLTVPEPGNISPSWTHVWEELEHTIDLKMSVFKKVPAAQREGEWLVLLDNPYTNDSHVCYPGLSFIEAAYLYGYFRRGLKNNEFIRLHKVEKVLMNHGSDPI